MGYGCDIFFFAGNGNFGVADIVFTVSGFKAKFGSDFKAEFKSFFRFFAKGSALFRFAFNAGNGNKSCNIAKDVFFVFFDEKIYVFKIDFHFKKSPFGLIHS